MVRAMSGRTPPRFHGPARFHGDASARVTAVLGPTNTGKTHLAIERMCAHSSGAIGFPLRLLAREVYDRVCAIKGASRVALITGEERIEPKDARWLLCTAEAFPTDADLAFVALDEAQLGSDRERGHVFTERLLHARGREETMLLGAGTLEPVVRALVPEAEIVTRPRFSTLSHVGARKLSRIPPRSAIVAFSAEQVYAIAEMFRRFRGGAAVVMGALSPETRNRQVALYQSGEVDYLVATDAIGMGLNLDLHHVAFAGLSKYDGQRQRRLFPAEMAQIAGRAGRHQRDGTFGTLAGSGGRDAEFTDEEVYAIEEHRFAPLSKLFWRDAQPRCDDLATLIGDLETPPDHPSLAPAPEAIDLAVLKRLAEDPEVSGGARTRAHVARLWEVASLPDFRQHGAETHARFVARLWQDLREGEIGADYVAQAIAQLDNPSGDIDTLQGRIAAIRSWAYIAQRRDWVRAREEMAARARAAEARLSDALHARLTERFVSRRTAVLMRGTGPDAGLLGVILDGDEVLVEGEAIGTLSGFRFTIDPGTRAADRKLLLGAAERHLPALIGARADAVAADVADGSTVPEWSGDELRLGGAVVARVKRRRAALAVTLIPGPALAAVPGPSRAALIAALEAWTARELKPLAPLASVFAASAAPSAGPELRALLIRLGEAGGMLDRAAAGADTLSPEQREALRRLGVRQGVLDLFIPALLRPAGLAAWARLSGGNCATGARPVLAAGPGPVPTGYRRLAAQDLRVDLAERLLRAAHGQRIAAKASACVLDPALARSMGLSTASYARLLQLAGFAARSARALLAGELGPPAPPTWRWRAPRAAPSPTLVPPEPRAGNSFAALAELIA